MSKMVSKRPRTGPASYKRSRTGAKPITHVPRWVGTPFNERRQCSLRYTEVIDIPLSLGFGTYVMNSNSLYDPNNTGFGHQPFGYDQLMAIYNHYTVTRCSIAIHPVTPTLSSNTDVTTLAVWNDDDNGLGGTVTEISTCCERSGSAFKTFARGGGELTPLRNTYKRKNTFVRPLGDVDRGAVASSPAELQCFIIGVQDYEAGTGTIKVKVDMLFTAYFDELKSLAPS